MGWMARQMSTSKRARSTIRHTSALIEITHRGKLGARTDRYHADDMTRRMSVYGMTADVHVTWVSGNMVVDSCFLPRRGVETEPPLRLLVTRRLSDVDTLMEDMRVVQNNRVVCSCTRTWRRDQAAAQPADLDQARFLHAVSPHGPSSPLATDSAGDGGGVGSSGGARHTSRGRSHTAAPRHRHRRGHGSRGGHLTPDDEDAVEHRIRWRRLPAAVRRVYRGIGWWVLAAAVALLAWIMPEGLYFVALYVIGAEVMHRRRQAAASRRAQAHLQALGTSAEAAAPGRGAVGRGRSASDPPEHEAAPAQVQGVAAGGVHEGAGTTRARATVRRGGEIGSAHGTPAQAASHHSAGGSGYQSG